MPSFVSASTAAARIVREVRSRQLLGSPFLIALDGGSASGKSTVAEIAAACLGAVLVQTDDFFAAEITDEGWNEACRWMAFDFQAGRRPDGTYCMQSEPKEQGPGEVVVIEGTYSARPELADLYDLTVLLDVPFKKRRTRLMEREGEAVLDGWHLRWDEAEAHYFRTVRPPSSFDLVVKND